MHHLITTVLMFPLWFSLTQQEPLTMEHIGMSGRLELAEESAQVLRVGYDQLTIAERAQLANEVCRDTGERAQVLLLEWLARETDVYVQGAILDALRETTLDTVPEKTIRPFLTAPNAHVQNSAMRLYGLLPTADFAYLGTLCQESNNPGFKIALFEALVQRNDTAFQSFPLTLLLKYRTSNDQVACAALRAALSAPGGRDADVNHWQAVAAESEHIAVRAAAASDAHVNNATIALKLAGDSQPAVRMAVFQSYQDGTDDALRHLLGLPADKDPVVRTAKVDLLRRLPQIHDFPEIRVLLRDSFADAAQQVREAAEAVLSGENMPRELALALTAEALESNHDSARLIAYRQICDRKFSELLEATRARIFAETRPENICAALTAFFTLETPGESADLAFLQPYTTHRSPYVRATVAHALGKLRVPESEPLIIRLATEDAEMMVKAHAFEAMGFFPQRVFLPYLEECFANREGSSNAARARAAACWATPRIHPETEEDFEFISQIAADMYHLATKPTIPEAMGMLVFDGNHVIANAIVSLARLSILYPDRDNLAYSGKKLLKLYDTAGKNPGQIPESVPTTDSLMDITRQGLQFLDGAECTQAALRPVPILLTLDYSRNEEESP